jgi:hypothetical protein
MQRIVDENLHARDDPFSLAITCRHSGPAGRHTFARGAAKICLCGESPVHLHLNRAACESSFPILKIEPGSGLKVALL